MPLVIPAGHQVIADFQANRQRSGSDHFDAIDFKFGGLDSCDLPQPTLDFLKKSLAPETTLPGNCLRTASIPYPERSGISLMGARGDASIARSRNFNKIETS